MVRTSRIMTCPKRYWLGRWVMGEKTNADILVSSCPACVMQLSSGVRQRKPPMQVAEIVELLEQAYKAAKEGH